MYNACESLECKFDEEEAWFDGWNSGYKSASENERELRDQIHYLNKRLESVQKDSRDLTNLGIQLNRIHSLNRQITNVIADLDLTNIGTELNRIYRLNKQLTNVIGDLKDKIENERLMKEMS